MRDPDFYLSADMRLIELQRSALGLPAPDRPDWENRAIADGPNLPDDPVRPPESAILNVIAVATPSEGIIPGAIVTLSLSVANEGVAPARDVRVGVPLPGGASYRPGSFVRDGTPGYDEIAERFFGAGLDVGDLAPKSRATFVWKIGARLGARPLVVAPQVSAAGAAIIGGGAIAISRLAIAPGAAAAAEVASLPPEALPVPLVPVEVPVPDLPFYELDETEAAAYAAAERDPAEKPAPPVVREAVLLLGTFDRPTFAFFDRTFRGTKRPTILQHCIFGGALACTRAYGDGGDPAGMRAHLDAQSQILHRVSLYEKLGKKEPIADYSGTLIARADALAPEPVGTPAIASDATRIVFETEIAEPSLAVLRSIQAERERWDFVKARQLTLALQAQRAVGGGGTPAQRAALENALRAYSQAAMTALQRLFVRIRLDRTTGALQQSDPELDRKAVALLEAIGALFG